MICPVCKRDMIVVEYHNIELDYCTGCKGVWFDSGELELLLESHGVGEAKPLLGDILASPEAVSSEDERKCPMCRHKMKKVTMGEEPAVLIDVCRNDHGLWFDGGEVAHVMGHISGRSGERGSAGEVIGFLEEVFGAPAGKGDNGG